MRMKSKKSSIETICRPILSRHSGRRLVAFCITAALAGLAMSCSAEPAPQQQPITVVPERLADVAAVRLNYRYEADVPPPPENPRNVNSSDRNEAVQAHFDQSRPQEVLDRTVASPDGKRVLAVYHKVTDMQSEFRLDMYDAAGTLLRHITADAMAAHFPDTIVWSPDSKSVAFVAMLRAIGSDPGNAQPDPNAVAAPSPTPAAEPSPITDATDGTAEPTPEQTPAAPVVPAGDNVLTFRSEQIYLCDADGNGLKPLTQTEGLIYFYYVWASDSSALAALAATGQEWRFLEADANKKGEAFTPLGRPRIVEKNGRERRLDDGLTAVRPVWSPDSAKVAAAFGDQVRVYDAVGTQPTQAAIPLRNDLLLSAQAYDRKQQETTETAPAPAAPTTLPDPNSLVSFNPIVLLNWPTDDQLYFQTAFVKRMKNETDSAISFARWHRLFLSPQPIVITK